MALAMAVIAAAVSCAACNGMPPPLASALVYDHTAAGKPVGNATPRRAGRGPGRLRRQSAAYSRRWCQAPSECIFYQAGMLGAVLSQATDRENEVTHVAGATALAVAVMRLPRPKRASHTTLPTHPLWRHVRQNRRQRTRAYEIRRPRLPGARRPGRAGFGREGGICLLIMLL